ncbi:MAG: TPM domain-containing protein [Bacteroidales bacterium]|jgi:uncharacterized membrane protein|nr:TPM domain-containing protein [Bacteroidales bacterium]
MAAFFSTRDKKRITAAITKAEQTTSGEIRVHIETYCPSSSLERAVFVFNQLKMYKTKDRNSVLIYLATESKKFAIVGDTGIHKVVPEGYWESVKEIMLNAFTTGEFVEGICDAVKKVGKKLARFFPYQEGSINELPNEVSIGE